MDILYGMSKKLTTERFIEKAKEVHGELYDYSLAEYKGAFVKVKIGCPEHGVWEQMATNHLSGYGCPNRSHGSGTRVNTTKESFIVRAKLVHKDYYDYSIVNYKGSQEKVKIICPEHGVFEQKATRHIQGSGCPDYSHKKFDKLSKEEFLQRAQLVHGEKYDYSLVSVNSSQDKLEIICKEHGIFVQLINDHTDGHGCAKCSNVYRRTTEEFIQYAIAIHGNKYSYGLVIFINNKSYVIIECPTHGKFNQAPSDHLSGRGCMACGIENKKYTTEEFIGKAKLKHHNKYDYSLVDYKSNKYKVKIICPEHGMWEQLPSNHLFGHACPKCAHTISKIETKWLDHLDIPELNRQKSIIINNKSFKVDAYDQNTNTIYEFYGDYWHGNPKLFDHNKMHPDIKRKTFGQVYEKTINREAKLKEAGYNVVSIWEYDYKQSLRKLI